MAQPVQRIPREQTAAQMAADLITFADGYEDAGHPAAARRMRALARDTIWLVQALEDERSARRSLQERLKTLTA